MEEIERKFLVISDAYKTEAFKQTFIVQGFLNTDAERTVRVRIRDEQGFLSVKGKSSDDGVARFEWEIEIPKDEAEALLKLCEPGAIEKTRYEVISGAHVFEIDQFYGANEGLIIAEIELENKNDTFIKPSWLGSEVTGQLKYYNSQLLKNPFKTWS